MKSNRVAVWSLRGRGRSPGAFWEEAPNLSSDTGSRTRVKAVKEPYPNR